MQLYDNFKNERKLTYKIKIKYNPKKSSSSPPNVATMGPGTKPPIQEPLVQEKHPSQNKYF